MPSGATHRSGMNWSAMVRSSFTRTGAANVFPASVERQTKTSEASPEPPLGTACVATSTVWPVGSVGSTASRSEESASIGPFRYLTSPPKKPGSPHCAMALASPTERYGPAERRGLHVAPPSVESLV